MSLRHRIGKGLIKLLTIDELVAQTWGPLLSSSGEHVSAESVQRLYAVYACVNVLAETLATLPPKLYRVEDDGGRSVVKDHLFAKALKNPFQTGTAFDFYEMLVWHLALRGRFFAMKVKVRGEVAEFVPIEDPDQVEVITTDDYELRFKIKGKEYTRDEVLYIQMHNGRSIIKAQADTFGKNQAISKYGATFFKNNATPNLVITSPNKFKDEESYLRFKKMWDDTYSGVERSNKVAIVDDGKKVERLSLTNEDSQFLDSNKYSDSQIAGLFRVPVYMIGNYDKATFSNIEHLGIQFARFTMAPWCRRVETALTQQCLNDKKLYVEFLMDSLERGDILSRYQAYRTGRESGFLSANEIRQRENMDPYEGGDDYLLPTTHTVVGEEEGGQQNG